MGPERHRRKYQFIQMMLYDTIFLENISASKTAKKKRYTETSSS